MESKSVFVAIVGKPNVGKSSLMNHFLGEKLAIVTYKPQTTRKKTTGILTKDDTQYVFIDTPGIYKPSNLLGQRMISYSLNSVSDEDVVLMMFDPWGKINEDEKKLIDKIKDSKIPAIAAINKIDKLKNEIDTDKKCQEIKQFGTFDEIFKISATGGIGTDLLLKKIESYAVSGPHFFADDAFTNLSEKEIAAEIVREKLLLNMRDEIPHGTNVDVENFKRRGNIVDISVVIYCDKPNHKGMIIGKNGSMLKKIATESRVDIENFFGSKVNLKCFVKVKEEWRESNSLLNEFGYKNESEN
jgi:GTP-binding protein Era